MESFQALLDGLCHEDLSLAKHMKKLLEDKICNMYQEIKSDSAGVNVDNYVTYEEEYLPECDKLGLVGDLESLGLCNGKQDKTKHAWLALDNQSYTWDSSQGPVVNEPLNLESNNTSFIKKMLDKINSDKGLKLNSCLVTYYPCADSSLTLHADDEINVCQITPICNLSVGTPRDIHFLRKSQGSTGPPAYCVTLAPGSLCTMQPGCQTYLKHRVPRGSVPGHRYSLSFRYVSNSSSISSPQKIPSTQTSEDCSSNLTQKSSPSKSFPSQISSKKPCTSVIFGTYITKGLIESRLAYGKRKCINVSNSGDKIDDITRRVEEFYENANPDDIEKIIFSFGTNDIRSRRGISRFWNPILNLIKITRKLFPKSIIYFQSVLPIKISKNFTAENFINFNKMLLNICVSERCSFIDIFRNFLSVDGNDYNESLYRDQLHLNRRGIGILASWIKYSINKGRFYPYVC